MSGVMAAGQAYAQAQGNQDVAGAQAMAQAEEQRSAADHAAVAQARSETKPIPAFVPTKETASDLSMIFGMLGVLGTALGGKAKTAGMEGMAAMTGMMQGYQQGRQDLYEKEYKQFQANLESIKSHNAEIQQELQQALKLSANDMDKGKAYAQLAMARLGAPVLQAKIQYEGVLKAAEWAHQMSVESARLARTTATEQARHDRTLADAQAAKDREFVDVYVNGRVMKITGGQARQMMEQGIEVQPPSAGRVTTRVIHETLDGKPLDYVLKTASDGSVSLTDMNDNPLPPEVVDKLQSARTGRASGAGDASQQQSQRMINALSGVTSAVESIGRLKSGATTGLLRQMDSKEGLSGFLFSSTARAMSTNEEKAMNTYLAGIGRNLAVLEASGTATGLAALSESLQKGVYINASEGSWSTANKLADIRRIAESSIQPAIDGGRLSDAQKQTAMAILEQLKKAVPFTTDDMADILIARERKKNPNAQTIAQTSLGLVQGTTSPGGMLSFPDVAAAQKAADAGQVKPGMKIIVNGQSGVWE